MAGANLEARRGYVFGCSNIKLSDHEKRSSLHCSVTKFGRWSKLQSQGLAWVVFADLPLQA